MAQESPNPLVITLRSDLSSMSAAESGRNCSCKVGKTLLQSAGSFRYFEGALAARPVRQDRSQGSVSNMYASSER